jgi:flagellar hook assembly protein FlgD
MYVGTKIEYQVQKEGMVSLKIFNADGALVKDLVNGVKTSGDFDIFWNGTANSGERVASGNYYYQLTVDAFRSVKKALILK